MTREEAIAILQDEAYFLYEDDVPYNRQAFDMAIQALSQEPTDAIDREYLFKVLDDFCGHDRTATITLDTLADIVYDMPSVTQKSGKWIPVSERLPEKGEYGKVLVTYIPSGGTLWTTVIIAHYSDLMGIAKPSFHIGEVGKESFYNITEQVIAWMPLPKPYEPQESEE